MKEKNKRRFHDVLRHIQKFGKKLELTENYLKKKSSEVHKLRKELSEILRDLYEIYDLNNED